MRSLNQNVQMGFILGLGLAVVVGVGLEFGDKVFTTDANVLRYISIGVPFVAATQPINSLSFVFDGVNFGASDFAYSAYSMVLVAAGSITSLFLLSRSYGFVGIWIALMIYMGLRTFAGIWIPKLDTSGGQHSSPPLKPKIFSYMCDQLIEPLHFGVLLVL